MSTRSAAPLSCAARAATATLLYRQNPMARSASAWCPGGRSEREAVVEPARRDLRHEVHEPAGGQPRREGGVPAGVGVRIERDEGLLRRRARSSRCGRPCGRAAAPRPSPRAPGTARQRSSRPSPRSRSRMAVRRPGCSGWSYGARWARNRSSKTRPVVTAPRARRPVRPAPRPARGRRSPSRRTPPRRRSPASPAASEALEAGHARRACPRGRRRD